jgi:hypothetical protein
MAGEFFVAAELSKRGYLVSLTMGNAKAVDLFAERGGRSICIQVKSAGGSYCWPLSADKTKIVDNVLFVFVALNVVGEQPDYYVLTPQEVRSVPDGPKYALVFTSPSFATATCLGPN